MSSSPGTSHSSTYGRALSPPKPSHDRSLSRPSSSTSIRSVRAPSPSCAFDDPVAIRNQMSTLKHTIRHQQAQLHNLENIILRCPRPLPELPADNMASAMSTSPPPSAFSPGGPMSTKMKRRSSYDVLQGIAGPESNLPLPRRDSVVMDDNGIREGIPMNFSLGSVSPTAYKRVSSPTRTLSRIPVASVGNARALADEGQPATLRPSPCSGSKTPLTDTDGSSYASSSTLQPPPSPNRRLSLTPGGTTKVLADLQTGVVNARNALENTKGQLRLSQRSVAQLTRQTEDLKEGRERLRLENEGLNNVVARKERLLQEVLERARKAESEAASFKAQLKTDTTTFKKTLREMESALSESTALSQKSEREYITLRDSIKSLTESWKSDTELLREEMRKREEKWRGEAEGVGKKYLLLVQELMKGKEATEGVRNLREEDGRLQKEVENHWIEELGALRGEVENSSRESEVAGNTARELASELARLRRLMQRSGRSPRNSAISSPIVEVDDAPP